MPTPAVRRRLVLDHPFSPRMIPGLILWMDAASRGLPSGTAIDTWPELSRSGAIIAQSTGANQPTLQITSGVPSIRGASSKWLNITNLPIYSSGAFTLFMVAKPASSAVQNMFGFGTATSRDMGIVDTYWDSVLGGVVLSTGLVMDTAAYHLYTARGDTSAVAAGVACTMDGKYSFKTQNRNGTSWTAENATTAWLGSQAGAAGSNYAGDTRIVLLFNRVLSSGEFSQVSRWLAQRYQLTLTTATHNIVLDGDSLVQGQTANVAVSDVLVAALPATRRMVNLGIGGQKIQTCLANYTTKVAPLYQPGRYAKNILMIKGGTNDLYQSRTLAQLEADIASYCQAAHATGWLVAIGTVTPRSDAGKPAGFDADRTTYNQYIRDNYASWGVDALMDVGADATIGPDGAELNATYYNADKTHHTTPGYAIVEGYYATALTALS